MSEINFDYGKIWMVEIAHRSKGDGVWVKALNAESEDEAISLAFKTFQEEGLNPLLIDSTIVTELEKGDDGGSSA